VLEPVLHTARSVMPSALKSAVAKWLGVTLAA
jgi:hypothetical protein